MPASRHFSQGHGLGRRASSPFCFTEKLRLTGSLSRKGLPLVWCEDLTDAWQLKCRTLLVCLVEDGVELGQIKLLGWGRRECGPTLAADLSGTAGDREAELAWGGTPVRPVDSGVKRVLV